MQSIGAKIRSMRLKLGMTLEDLADRSELSKGFLSQLERDLTSPSIATLVDILECLGSNLKEFFSDEVNEKVVFKAEDCFVKENYAEGISVTWLVPNAQKNEMEPILLTLTPGHEPIEYDPFEGEEFGYVLSGSIYLLEGRQRHRVRKGESFYLKCNVSHGIECAGKTPAKVLWVSTPPNF